LNFHAGTLDVEIEVLSTVKTIARRRRKYISILIYLAKVVKDTLGEMIESTNSISKN
jgi:hypothetical protein